MFERPINRRRVVGGPLKALAGASLYAAAPSLPAQADAASAPEPPSVHEITMAAPDIIRVEVREAPLRRGRIVKLPSPRPEAHGSWIQLNGKEWGVVIGPQRDHVRIADEANLQFLDRTQVSQPSGYGSIGTRKVVAVYRKSVPWNSGTVKGGGQVASFAHFIYLKLDSPLAAGPVSLRWPQNLLPTTEFVLDHKVTRSCSIHVNQVGYHPDDISKLAYLSLWLPGGPHDGAVDFRGYGFDHFNVIDGKGEIAFSGPIALRVGPQYREPGYGLMGDLLTYVRPDGTTFKANRAGTYVFNLDFSNWRPAHNGTYRLAIPGLGTSDPFEVGDDVWHRAARASMGGLYNQRSGIAIDGRFGYTRPECYTERSGVVVRQTRLPWAFSKETGGFVDRSQAVTPPWITDEIIPNAWGGYQDAGNWPRHITHIHVSYLLLDVYEQLPPAIRDLSFGMPQTDEVLPDPIYQGKRFPDILNEAIWNLDFFRRMQRSDGAVRGGIDAAGGPQKLEPSWLESQTVFAYAPDPEATFIYAASATKLATVLLGLYEAAVAGVYRESAVRAWEWAETAFADQNIAFGEAQGILNMPAADYQKRLEPLLQRTKNARLWAAGTLFRLTGEERFNKVVREQLVNGVDAIALMDGAWEYANSKQTGADRDIQERIRRDIVVFARNNIVAPQWMASYSNMKILSAPLGWGEGLAPGQAETAALIRAHRITGDNDFLTTMLNGSSHILGANQMGMSFTVGLGQRWPLAPLHVDSIDAGDAPPNGLTIYGWANPWALEQYWYVWGPEWATLSDKVPTKRIEPKRSSLPVYEYLIQFPLLVMSAEYTVHQTIATTAAMWTYLHGYRVS